MRFPRLHFDDSISRVVSSGRCVGCAACVVACPTACLEYREGKPVLTGDCSACGICAQVCPRYEPSIPDLERMVFGRERRSDEEFGVYRRMVIARSRDEEVLRVCQDGGVVSTLLRFAIEEKIIEGAAVSGVSGERPLYPSPRLVTTPEEVLECAGTRYSFSPNLLALQEGVKRGMKGLAFVGTPCQVLALRRMQKVPLRRHVRPLRFVIGLMCTESFDYEGLMVGYVQRRLGVDLRDVKKVNIKGRMLITTRSGAVSYTHLTLPTTERV